MSPRYSETYTFHTLSDDGIRLWVDGKKLIAKLLWSSKSQVKQVIPSDALWCTGGPGRPHSPRAMVHWGMLLRALAPLALAALCCGCIFDASGLGVGLPAADGSPAQDRGADVAADLLPLADAAPPDLRREGSPGDGPPGDGPSADTIPGSWWDTAWKRRRRITFDNSQQPSALVDFPVLIVLKAGRIDYAATRPQGADLRFVDADGQLLAHEIESFDATGSSFVWVKVPQIDGGSASDLIWLYHGNKGAADGQQAAAVWSNGYRAVWHLHDDFQDSTAQGQHATNVKSTDAPGKFADGQRFNGVDQYIDTGYTDNPGTWTISAWIQGEAAPAAQVGSKDAISGALMKEETFQLTWDHLDPKFRGAASLRTTVSDWKAATFATLKAKTWHLLAASYDGAALRAYRDGALVGQGV